MQRRLVNDRSDQQGRTIFLKLYGVTSRQVV